MSRRIPTLWLLLTVATAAAPAHAAGVASFRLKNTDPSGASPVQKVLASIVPPGTVMPPDPSTSPLTILNGSSGFNADDLKVSLGDGQTPKGDPFQALALDFGTGGLAPGGQLLFSLNLSPTYAGMLNLVLPTSVKNLTIESYTPPGSGGAGGGGQTNVPEPLSILVWSSVGALGLVRARAYRRRHARELEAADA